MPPKPTTHRVLNPTPYPLWTLNCDQTLNSRFAALLTLIPRSYAWTLNPKLWILHLDPEP